MGTTLVKNGKFTVKSNMKCSFNWLVHARRGIFTIEPLKSNTVVRGDGPYRYIQ